MLSARRSIYISIMRKPPTKPKAVKPHASTLGAPNLPGAALFLLLPDEEALELEPDELEPPLVPLPLWTSVLVGVHVTFAGMFKVPAALCELIMLQAAVMFPELTMLNAPATSVKAGSSTSVKFPVTSRAALIVASFGKPSTINKSVLLAIVKPPTCVNESMVTLVRAALPTIESRPVILVKFGVEMVSKKLSLKRKFELTVDNLGIEMVVTLWSSKLSAAKRLGNERDMF